MRSLRVVAVSLALLAAPAAAQDEAASTPRSFAFADLSLGVLALGYGLDATEWLELQLVAQYYQPWYVVDDVRGVGGELRVVLVPFRAAEHALIVVEGLRLAAVFGAGDRVGLAYSLRASVGYELTYDWFRLQVAFGFQHHAVEELDASQTFSGLVPSADLLAGVVF